MTLTFGQTLRALHAEMPLIPQSVGLTFLGLVVLWDLWFVTASLPHDIHAVAVDPVAQSTPHRPDGTQAMTIERVSALFLPEARDQISPGQRGFVVFEDRHGGTHGVAARVSHTSDGSSRVILEAPAADLLNQPGLQPRTAVVRLGKRSPLDRWLSGDETQGDDVIIETQSGRVHRLTVTVASTPRQRQRGLMGRDHLLPGHGMLLVEPEPRPIAVWMKDTSIPLDVVFIGSDQRVLNIVRNLEPFDLQPHWSKASAIAALELNGGEADDIGIRPGDRIFHPVLEERRATMP